MERRVKANRIATYGCMRTSGGEWQFTVSVVSDDVIPDEFEIVWTEPDVHQCEGLLQFGCEIFYNGRIWCFNKDSVFVCAADSCPCCDWVAPQ